MKKLLMMMAALSLLTFGMVSCNSNNEKVKKTDTEKNKKENEFVDLGLRSGTKWKNVNENGHYTFDKAEETFLTSLPSEKQWVELMNDCEWTWVYGESESESGYMITGPNGNSIFLPAAGRRYDADVENIGHQGYYWSGASFDMDDALAMTFANGDEMDIEDLMYFGDRVMCLDRRPRYECNSVRLVQD